MFRLAALFLVIAVLAAFVGFGGEAGSSWVGAEAVFFVCIVLAALCSLGGDRRRPVA
jgi:uncharacterized membrane protein YtjA (UPF0391 family)